MNKHKLFLKKIRSLHEDDFSRDIIIPLLRRMGYQYVNFHGGSNEEGKDIIATKKSVFLETEVSVIQSKMLQTKRSAASSQKFGEIAHQLRLCLNKKVPCSDGHLRIPSMVILITPYEIDTRHLRDQFEIIEMKGILIIDAPRLCALVEEHWPEAFNEVVPPIEHATIIDIGEVKNLELHSALHIDSDTEYSEYYSDLSFFVGETESRKVLSSQIHAKFTEKSSYSKTEWDELVKIDEWISKVTKEKLINEDLPYVESQFKAKLSEHRNKENQGKIQEFNKIADQISGRITDANGTIKNLKEQLPKILTQKRSLTTVSEEEIEQIECLFESINKIDFHAAPISIRSDLSEIHSFCLNSQSINSKPKIIDNIEKSISYLNEAIELQERQYGIESQIIPYPQYIASLQPTKVCNAINKRINETSKLIEKLNNRELTAAETKSILEAINIILRCIDNITNKLSCETIKFSLIEKHDQSKVLDISAHVLFDSGCNIAVYGEAGAGKSTTLHVYAEKLYKHKDDTESVIFIPLNRITSKLNKLEPDHRDRVLSGTTKLEALLGAFLHYKDIPATPENKSALIDHLNANKKTTIIIDALDEAANNAEWIIQALSEIPKSIRCAQVITSSRDCVKYLKEIEFLGITLLPFTRDQLKRFIFGWIKIEDQKVNLWNKIIEKELFEVANNPLLATIICSLHENGVPIPENEPEIYKSKIDLLCGSYDHYKNIKRTKNSKQLLEDCCRKIAYQMHRRQLRQASRSDMEKYLSEGMNYKIPETTIQSAIEDLISICNILKFSSDDGTYGFGHLRYQEYLASDEISRTRSIDITMLTKSNWWAGALYLYSFSNRIDPIIDEILAKHSSITPHKNNLLLMVKAQPAAMQRSLTKLISKHSELDSLEGKDSFGFLDEDASYIPEDSIFDFINR